MQVDKFEAVDVDGMHFGRIDEFEGQVLRGWLYSPLRAATPVVLIDGVPATLKSWPVRRDDVRSALGAHAEAGWEFFVPSGSGRSTVELFALVDGTLRPVAVAELTRTSMETNFWRQLDRAREVASQPGAVAITSWDGAHNPIGRAKVLYDVLEGRRPAVIFTYLHEEFGTEIWPPLRDVDIPIVAIPWAGRRARALAISAAGIAFDTVWICKPRLPNFELAATVASPAARLVLDLDDNEHHFSSSKASQAKLFGGAGLSRSRVYEGRISARTVASRTLQRDFGGEIVRHVRKPFDRAPGSGQRKRDAGRALRIGFVGTVRPHKNILGAARAIRTSSWALNLPIEFHVRGDVRPASLVQELEATGATVGGYVASNELYETLETFDVVLTGFPSADAASAEANEYQITSKIGDAMAVGRPSLVPAIPSVLDLSEEPSVFLFTAGTFVKQLQRAIEHSDDIVLSEQFTTTAGYRGFETAEALAHSTIPAANALAGLTSPRVEAKSAETPTILLLWKQHDSGLYGRRVDQVARAYKKANPDATVRILEVMHTADEKQYQDRAGSWLSEASNVLAISKQKSTGGPELDGVIRDQLVVGAAALVGDRTLRYLAEHGIFPWNAVVVVFPFFRFYADMREELSPYVLITDVVDNQVSWAKGDAARQDAYALQYHELLRASRHVVFNSSNNLEEFVRKAALPDDAAHSVIENWYDAPSETTLPSTLFADDGVFDVVYSGNMNDRVDWGVLAEVAKLTDVRLHLIGGAERAPQQFRDLLQMSSVVYHGPQNENYVLAALSRTHLAVMPHTDDDVSTYMNPLKLFMYEHAGVPAIASAVPGIDERLLRLHVAPTTHAFVEQVLVRVEGWRDGGRPAARNEPAASASVDPGGRARYADVLDEALAFARSSRGVAQVG